MTTTTMTMTMPTTAIVPVTAVVPKTATTRMMAPLSGRRRASAIVRAARALWGMLAVVLVLLGALGCDGPYQQFLDAIPTASTSSDGPVQVFLGIDGLSAQTFERARERGAFAGYKTSDLVTPFPGTSDYSWTRTLRAGALGGYEVQYFDPQRNVVEGAGITGLAEHPLREGIAGVYPCYQRFDFLGDGEAWQFGSYLDPAAGLRTTLDAMFDTIAARGRTQAHLLAYLLNVDIAGHQGGPDQVVAMLIELDRRIRAFQADHGRSFKFTIFADHGNAHRESLLVDPRQILSDVGVTPVDVLTPSRFEALPIVHTRVNYVALHTDRANVVEIAARTSRHAHVDLAVARLPDGPDGAGRFGIWRQGQVFTFGRDVAGTITVDDPESWSWLDVDFQRWRRPAGGAAALGDREAFDATVASSYPDIFYRVATAFTHPASRFPADILLSMPDDIASFGFAVPGAVGVRAVDGFHGSLSRASTMSVLASEGYDLPPAVRGDDLADMFPILAGVRD